MLVRHAAPMLVRQAMPMLVRLRSGGAPARAHVSPRAPFLPRGVPDNDGAAAQIDGTGSTEDR